MAIKNLRSSSKEFISHCQDQYQKIKVHYPEATCELEYRNPFELLIATILSAQCTDKMVNRVTKVLFKQLPGPLELSQAELPTIENIIKSTGFYKNKAKNIRSCALSIVKLHNLKVPEDLEQLTGLAGVGRKTANVVLGNAFGITKGIVVDTHVKRIAFRLGWSKNSDPVKVELDLLKIFPEKDWIMLSHHLIFHGRKLCFARSPKCDECFMTQDCPKKK